MASVEEIDSMLKKYLDPMNKRMGEMQETLPEITNENQAIKENYKTLDSEVKELRNKVKFLNIELIKKKNILILGIPERKNEDLGETAINIFRNNLGIRDIITGGISEIRRMSRDKGSQRPIKIKLSTKRRKMQILEKTKGTRREKYPQATHGRGKRKRS